MCMLKIHLSIPQMCLHEVYQYVSEIRMGPPYGQEQLHSNIKKNSFVFSRCNTSPDRLSSVLRGYVCL